MTTFKPLLLIMMLVLIPACMMGQIYYPVTVTSGTQSYTGYTATVTSTGSPGSVSVSANCGTGPYFIGQNGAQNSYIYTFNNPVSYAKVQIYGLNDNEVVAFKVNGTVYPVSNAPVSPYPGTCGAVYAATFVAGNLTSTGNTVGSTTQAGVQVIIHPVSTFTTFEVYYANNYGDGCVYNMFFAGTCTSSLSISGNPSGTICSSKTLALTSTPISGASYSWTGPSFTSNNQNVTFPNVQTTQSGTYTVSASVTGCNYTASTTVSVLQSPPVPVATSNAPVCSGDSLLLSMNSIPGVTYGWFGPNGYVSNAQNYHLINTAASDSGYYIAADTAANHCISSDTIFAPVHQSLPAPGILVKSSVGDTICTGGTIPFYTLVSNASVNCTYQWKKNGIPIPGATSNTYTATAVGDLDVFSCVVTSYFTVCQVPNKVESAPVTIRVQSLLPPPTVTISAYPNNYVSGDTVTFTAYTVNGGINLTFQWYKNGVLIPGANTSSYQTKNVTQGDKVRVVVTSSFPCAVPNTGSSNVIAVAVPQLAGKTYDVQLFPNPNKGNFTLAGTVQDAADVVAQVTDAAGKIIYQEKVQVHNGLVNRQLNLSNPPGSYILNIRSGTSATVIPFTILR